MMQDAHQAREAADASCSIPISDQTRGHGTHSLPHIWGEELEKFLAELK